VRVKEQSHATRTKVAISVDIASRCVDLRVGPQVTDALYIDNYQLVTRPLKSEVAKCLFKTQHINPEQSE